MKTDQITRVLNLYLKQVVCIAYVGYKYLGILELPKDENGLYIVKGEGFFFAFSNEQVESILINHDKYAEIQI